MPGVKIDVGHWITGVGVDDLEIQVQRNARFIVGDVLADQLASDIWGVLATE